MITPHKLGIGRVFGGALLDVTVCPEHTDVMRSAFSLKPAAASGAGGRTRL